LNSDAVDEFAAKGQITRPTRLKRWRLQWLGVLNDAHGSSALHLPTGAIMKNKVQGGSGTVDLNNSIPDSQGSKWLELAYFWNINSVFDPNEDLDNDHTEFQSLFF